MKYNYNGRNITLDDELVEKYEEMLEKIKDEQK